jgi:sensor histidine kinase YesM
MLYLSYVWQILSSSYGMVAVTVGNMSILFCFLRPRFKWWIYPILVVLTYLALPIIYRLGTTIFGLETTASLLLAFLGYWNIGLILISFNDGFWKMISLIFTLSILNRLFTFLGYILHFQISSFLGREWAFQATITLVIVVLYVIISIVCWFVLREKGRTLIQTGLGLYNWAILGSIALFAKLIIDFSTDYVFSMNPYSDWKIIWGMIALSLFVLAFLALYLFSTLNTIKHMEIKVTNDRLAFEKEAQQRYYETRLHNQEEIRKMKHDLNGHLNTVAHLLSEDNKEAALSYLSDIHDYVHSNQKVIYSQDPYINAVVTNYAEMFAQNNITFEFDIQHRSLEKNHVELCLSLNNALQNALEASMKMEAKERFIKIQIKSKHDKILFRISNRFNGELNINNGLLRTSKKNDGHGYGISSIKNAAESVGGFSEYTIEGDMFVLDVAI